MSLWLPLLLAGVGCRKPPPPPPPVEEAPPPRDELAEAQALLSGGGGAAAAARASAGERGGAPLPAPGWTELKDPCEGGGTPYALYFRSATEGYVGCGEGIGLFGTKNGGDSFTRAHPSDDLYVFHLQEDNQGRLLVCGNDYAPIEGNVLLHRQRGDGWEPIAWFSGNPADRSAVNMSNCGRVAAMEDGTLVMMSLTIGDLTWSKDGGRTWSPMERYWEEANLNGQHSAWPLWELEAVAGDLYASGSMMSLDPSFFRPSDHPRASWYHMEQVSATDEIRGEAQSMATPDQGQTWVVGGRDQDRSREASGFIFHSTDGGRTWEHAKVNDVIDVVKDIAFSQDGSVGVAVGHRYPPRGAGGFVLITVDGGASWSPLDVKVPPLQSVAIRDGFVWVAGDHFLARGSL